LIVSRLWSQSPSNFGWLEPEPKIFQMVELELEIWVPVQESYTYNTLFSVFWTKFFWS